MNLKEYLSSLQLSEENKDILHSVLSTYTELHSDLSDAHKEKILLLTKSLDELVAHGQFCSCGVLLTQDNTKQVGDIIMCDVCYRLKYFFCSKCLTHHPISNRFDVDSCLICKDCADKMMKPCPACGQSTISLHTYAPGEEYCSSCYSEATRTYGMGNTGGGLTSTNNKLPALATEIALPESVKSYIKEWYSRLYHKYSQYKLNTIQHYYQHKAINNEGVISLGKETHVCIDMDLLYTFIVKYSEHAYAKDGKDMDKRLQLIFKNIKQFLSVGDNIITYSNDKDKVLSTKITTFISYIEKFIDGLTDSGYFTDLAVTIVKIKLEEIQSKLTQVTKGFKIKFSNDINYKLEFAKNMQKTLATCQRPGNCDGHSAGFYDWFINGNNIILGIYDSNDRICGRILCRYFLDENNEEYIFVDRPYINSDLAGESNKDTVVTESIKYIKSLGYKVIITVHSAHDKGNTDYVKGLSTSAIQSSKLYQPSRRLDFISVGYYCDSGTVNTYNSNDIRIVTTQLPNSLYIIN